MATRHERVVLDLEDRFSSGMVKAAAATALLDKQLNSLSGRSVASHRALATTERDVTSLGRSTDSSGRQIDKLSGRLQILAEVAGAVGPALIPIGAAAVPAIAGLANQLGVAALAGGTAILAFQGVGTALKAMNDYQLAPTAAHLLALQEAMSAVGPAGRDFVRQLAEMEPLFKGIQNTARQGLFPGVTDVLQGIATRAPEVNHLIETISTTLGGLMSEAGQGIQGGALDSFIRSLDTEARPALTQLGHSIADVTLGLASLMQAFMPLSLGFGAGMERAAAGFKTWADGLSQTQGFKDFVAYIQSTGPQVLSLLGALGNDFVQIVEAAAPLGGPVLESLTAIARAISSIADSPLGTPIFTAISALSAYNLALKATTSLQRSTFAPAAIGRNVSRTRASLSGLTKDVGVIGTTWATAGARSERESARLAESSGRVRGALASVGKGAAVLGGVGLLASGAADKLNLTNTATLGLAGSMVGPLGAGIGAVAGAFLDANAAAAGFNDNLAKIQTSTTFTEAKKRVQELQAQIADLENHANLADFLGDFSTGVGLLAHGHLTDSGLYDDLDKAKKKLAELNGEAAAGSPALAAYSQSIRNSGTAAGHTAAEINGMVSAMQANRTAALGSFDAETQYRQALKAAQAQAAKNNAGIRGNSDAALANRSAISGLAAAWNNQSAAVRNNVSRFHEARSAFIQTATAMGVPIAQARRLADRLLAIPKSRVIKLNILGSDHALSQLQALQRQLAGLHDKTVTVTMAINNASHAWSVQAQHGIGGAGADGATVVDSGRPYADRHLYLVADREEIVSNRRGQADRYRPVLKAINADMPRERIRGMLASGGTAGWGMPSWSGGWKMPPAETPNLGNWYHQILAAIRDGLGGGNSLTAEIKHLNAEIKDGKHQIAELSKARKGESKAERASREREVKALERHQKALEKQAEQAKNIRTAVHDFNLNSVLPTVDPKNPIYAGTKSALGELQHSIAQNGGVWTKAIRRHADGLLNSALRMDKLNQKADRLATTYETQKQAADEAAQAVSSMKDTMLSFGQQVSGAFASPLFGLTNQDGSPLASSPGGVLSSLSGDSKSLSDFIAATGKLGGGVLDTGVLSELYSSHDLGSAQALAAASPDQLASINDAAKQRQALMDQLAAQSGNAVYGNQLTLAQQAAITAASTANLTQIAQQAAQVQAAQMGQAIRDGIRELKHTISVQVFVDGKKLGKSQYEGVVDASHKAKRQTTTSRLAS